jgi:hypothetical protein
MNKYIISILVIASAMSLSTVSAESGATVTTATGTTVSTGTTATGTTATGTTTGTGVKCTTGSGVTRVDNQEAIMAAQQAFAREITRLVSVKQSAYSGAQTLTGSARVDALQVANTEFRSGFKAAQKTLSLAKKERKSNHQEIRECREDKREVKKEHKEEKKEKREETKAEIKDLKERIKALREKRDEVHGQSTGRRQ